MSSLAVVGCWLNLKFELHPDLFCSLLLSKACFYIFIGIWGQTTPKIMVEMHTLITEVLCWKTFETSIRNYRTSPTTPRRRRRDFFGPAARRRRRPKLTGDPPLTQWRRRRALYNYNQGVHPPTPIIPPPVIRFPSRRPETIGRMSGTKSSNPICLSKTQIKKAKFHCWINTPLVQYKLLLTPPREGKVSCT